MKSNDVNVAIKLTIISHYKAKAENVIMQGWGTRGAFQPDKLLIIDGVKGIKAFVDGLNWFFELLIMMPSS
jgi:hypothetical protein